jgi:hypothetical protein
MDLKNSYFRFNSVLKREEDIKFEALEIFPTLNEISFQSRVFPQYADCVKSCKGMMEDMAKGINLGIELPKYKVGAEVNPVHTGNQTLSKDWGDSEVARFWIYDKAMEGNGKSINAVCKASIFAIPKEVSSQSVN